jgi:hypothetical protein
VITQPAITVEQLARITAATLIVVGDADIVAPASGNHAHRAPGMRPASPLSRANFGIDPGRAAQHSRLAGVALIQVCLYRHTLFIKHRNRLKRRILALRTGPGRACGLFR